MWVRLGWSLSRSISSCCSYYDSVPTLIITGQVPTAQLKRGNKSRQIGFQETDVVSIYESVTVLLDVCDDVQRAEIDPEKLRSFTPPDEKKDLTELETRIDQALGLIRSAERSVI